MLPREERYARTTEFLEICRAFWNRNGPVTYSGKYYQIENGHLNTPFEALQRTLPEIFIAGGSMEAQSLAIKCGTLWMRMGDTPDNLRESNRRVLAAGKEVGLRMAIIARPTRDAAIRDARALIDGLDPALAERNRERDFVQNSDSVSIKAVYRQAADAEWLSPYLWMGAVRTHGPATVCLVGSPEDLSDVFIQYKKVGVSQFILSGWPKREEMIYFGRAVLPLVREKERALR
jgi:alkanesulfonate monooxygenase